MPKIIPFRGVLYNQNKIRALAEVVTPPYDIISSHQQKKYYRRNKYNIIRLILGREYLRDNERNNKYTRAAKFLNNWLKKGVLKKDRKPSIYIYSQQYYHKGEKRTRLGFIALMRIENFNKSSVLPHEDTFVKPKQDRLNLLRKTKANLSPIFSIFSDYKGKVTPLLKKYYRQSQPCINFELEKVTHKLWRLTDKLIIDKITKEMKNKQIFIADGHHRYEAAMEFYNEMRKRLSSETDRYSYIMVYFVASTQGGLTILPTHRLVKDLPRGLDKYRLKKRLSEYFKLTKFNNYVDILLNMEKEGRKHHLFGMYEGGDFYLLRLKNEKILDSIIGKERPKEWKKLEVVILHRLIFDEILCLKEGRQEKIGYTRDAPFAIKMVDSGNYRIAFFVNPMKISQLTAIAGSGMRMPHKSTYFYPKVVSGLVINKFDCAK
jgi:uncharacterized protein (DUF1015 family)